MPANPAAIQQRRQTAIPPQYAAAPPTRQPSQPGRRATPISTPYESVPQHHTPSSRPVQSNTHGGTTAQGAASEHGAYSIGTYEVDAPPGDPTEMETNFSLESDRRDSGAMEKELKMLTGITEDMRRMAEQASNTAVLEQAKHELEQQVIRMQQTLHAVNQHLEEEQQRAGAAAAQFEEERGELLSRIEQHEASLLHFEQLNEDLKKEIGQLEQHSTTQTSHFAVEKQSLNSECARVREELARMEEKLAAAEKDRDDAKQECGIAKGWLDRGVSECQRITQECEEAKRQLAKTAHEWEDDHTEMAQKLERLEQEHRDAIQERGALAVNLTVARARVVEDSRNLHMVVPTLRGLAERCAVLGAALQSSNPSALKQMREVQGYAPGSDVLGPPAVQEEQEHIAATPQSSHHIRSACNELFKNFFAVLQAASGALQQWEAERDLTSQLPRKIQVAQAEHLATKETNEKLKLRLNELRAECEKWRQNAQQINPTDVGLSNRPLSRQERQSLVQAQSVAATLYREKQSLQQETSHLQTQSQTLRTNLLELQAENKLMKDEIHRLRVHLEEQTKYFDTFRPIPPGQ